MELGKMVRFLFLSLLDLVRRNLATIICHVNASPVLVINQC